MLWPQLPCFGEGEYPRDQRQHTVAGCGGQGIDNALNIASGYRGQLAPADDREDVPLGLLSVAPARRFRHAAALDSTGGVVAKEAPDRVCDRRRFAVLSPSFERVRLSVTDRGQLAASTLACIPQRNLVAPCHCGQALPARRSIEQHECLGAAPCDSDSQILHLVVPQKAGFWPRQGVTNTAFGKHCLASLSGNQWVCRHSANTRRVGTVSADGQNIAAKRHKQTHAWCSRR